jgi:hypothetical protein
MEAVDGIASVVEQLNERVRELERRVSALEGQPEKPRPAKPALTVPPIERTRPPATWRGFPPPQTPAGSVPVIGKAVLGIAGAYLLRAITESGTVPKLPVVMVAIVYAGLWMVWAVRIHAARRFAGNTYGITSALILSPLLWESTVRFQILSPASTGAVLVAFAALALALAWRRELYVVPWMAMLAATFTALALIVATHELVPFTTALLAVALVTEIAACLGHHLTLRAVPAFAADLAVLLLVNLMTSAEGIPEGYRPATATTLTVLCLALFAIYGGSIGIRTFWLRQRITIFEIVQGVLAFVIAFYGAVRASHGSVAPALDVFFLLLAAACYSGALSRFAEESHTRNRRVSATWAAALLVAGSLLLFPVDFQVPFLCMAAVVAAFVYTRTSQISLGLHASLFLAAAATVSPLPSYVVHALARTVPSAPDWRVWMVAVSAALCYAVGSRRPEDQGSRRALWVVPAVLVGFAGAAFAVAAIVWLAAGRMELAASRLSVIRTILNCALALALGFLGSRWKHVELGWVAYTAVAFGTLKLVFEDLRFGNAASLVVSLLFYGSVLILLPRLTYRSRSETCDSISSPQ